jgi:hypothetical protein
MFSTTGTVYILWKKVDDRQEDEHWPAIQSRFLKVKHDV